MPRPLPTYLWIAIAFAVGCGRIGYEQLDGGAMDASGLADARVPDAGSIDGAAPRDGGSSGDAAVSADGGMAPSCRTLGCPGRCAPGPFGDEFEDGVRSDGWGTHGGLLTEAGGVLSVTAAADADALYASWLFYPLESFPISVEVVSISDPAALSVGCLSAVDEGFDNLSICETQGELVLDFESGGIVRLPFDPVQHRWWRIRRESVEGVMETSPDGVSWTERGRRTTNVQSRIKAVLESNAFGLATSGATYSFDHLSVGSPAPGGEGEAIGCAMSGLADDFEDGDPAPLWETSNDTGAIAMESAGAVILAPPLDAASGGQAFFRTIDYWELSDGALVLSSSDTLAGGDSIGGFEALGIDSVSGVGIQIANGRIAATITTDYLRSQTVDIAFDAAQHRWARLREAAGTTYWELSPDRAAWTTLWTQATPSSLGAVRVLLYTEKYSGVATGDLRFDALNPP